MSAALAADRVSQIAVVAPSDITAVGPEDSPSGCVIGVLSLGGRVIWMLSAERLLWKVERGCPAAASNR